MSELDFFLKGHHIKAAFFHKNRIYIFVCVRMCVFVNYTTDLAP